MSTSVLPTLKGLGYDLTRSIIWGNSVDQFVSGKEIRINNGWTYPRYKWDLTFNFLRSAAAYTEYQQLFGFYNARNGSYDSFLYADAVDNSVTLQTIGIGDGTTRTFQLVRTFGSFIEPVLAPNSVATVYVDGVDKSGLWTVANWGTSTPGLLTFSPGNAPANGKVITATFTYYFPCRFNDDQVAFTNFMSGLYSCNKLSFMSIK